MSFNYLFASDGIITKSKFFLYKSLENYFSTGTLSASSQIQIDP